MPGAVREDGRKGANLKPSAVAIGTLLVHLRIDRVAVIMLEVGLRQIGGTTSKCAAANCVAIAGATAQPRVVSSAGVGTTLRVVVTASNRFGAPTATSAQTAVVS